MYFLKFFKDLTDKEFMNSSLFLFFLISFSIKAQSTLASPDKKPKSSKNMATEIIYHPGVDEYENPIFQAAIDGDVPLLIKLVYKDEVSVNSKNQYRLDSFDEGRGE